MPAISEDSDGCLRLLYGEIGEVGQHGTGVALSLVILAATAARTTTATRTSRATGTAGATGTARTTPTAAVSGISIRLLHLLAGIVAVAPVELPQSRQIWLSSNQSRRVAGS